MHRHFSIVLACLMFTACGANESSQWENLDYKSVYRQAQGRENDPYYEPPSNIGCLDDDLYSCGR